MADVYVDEAALQAIGSAIRSKNGLNTAFLLPAVRLPISR